MFAVAGQIAIDYLMFVERFPEPNSSTKVDRLEILYGGAGANCSATLAKLGADVSLISIVGNDFSSSGYENHLEKLGVDLSHLIRVEDLGCAKAFMVNDSMKNQVSYFYWGAARLFEKLEPPREPIERARFVHIATGHPRFNYMVARIARECEAKIGFDPGQDLVVYDGRSLSRILELVDIIFCNEFELSRIMDMLGIEDEREMIEDDDRILVVTMGERGSRIIAKDREIEIPAVRPERFVDPTGAGDSYRAAFLYAMSRGLDLEDCGRFASVVASFVVEDLGAQTNLPTLEMALDRFERSFGYKPL